MKHCFTICIDMDDTIENLLEAWLAWLNTKYNYNVKPEQVVVWGMEAHYPELTYAQIFEPLKQKEFWKTVKPKTDAIEYLNKLVLEHQDIYIVTSAKYNTVYPKVKEVLLKYFPMIDHHNIITIYNKQMLKCDIMIDDNVNNLIGGDYYKLLFNAPYNQIFPESAWDVKRVNSWEQIYNIIHTLDWLYTVENKNTIDYVKNK